MACCAVTNNITACILIYHFNNNTEVIFYSSDTAELVGPNKTLCLSIYHTDAHCLSFYIYRKQQ